MNKLLNRATVVLTLALTSASCGDAANLLTGGNILGNTGVEIALSRQATVDNCCGITIIEFTGTTGKTAGCGQIADYKYINSVWVRQSLMDVATGAGSPSSRLAVCPT